MTDTVIQLGSGRTVGVSSFGEPTSRSLVILCNPTAAAGAFDPDPQVTTRHGVHVIVVDRPGYGGSDAWSDNEIPTVEVTADDIAEYFEVSELRQRIEAEEVSVGAIGWGWGGATALSFASRHPYLATRVAVVGTVRPSRARQGQRPPPAAELLRPRYISSVSGAARGWNAEDLAKLNPLGADENDPDLDQLGTLGRLRNLVGDTLHPPPLGVAFDRLAARDTNWADNLQNLAAPTLLLYGDRDDVAQKADGKWYRRHIADSRFVTAYGSGRLAIIPAWDSILDHLAPAAGET